MKCILHSLWSTGSAIGHRFDCIRMYSFAGLTEGPKRADDNAANRQQATANSRQDSHHNRTKRKSAQSTGIASFCTPFPGVARPRLVPHIPRDDCDRIFILYFLLFIPCSNTFVFCSGIFSFPSRSPFYADLFKNMIPAAIVCTLYYVPPEASEQFIPIHSVARRTIYMYTVTEQ